MNSFDAARFFNPKHFFGSGWGALLILPLLLAGVVSCPAALQYYSGISTNKVWDTTVADWGAVTGGPYSRAIGLTLPTNTWFDVAGSAAITNTSIPISPANPTVFFRLRLP